MAEELNLTITPNVAASVLTIRQDRHREARNVIVSFEGLQNGGRFAAPRDLLHAITEDEMHLVFETLQEFLPNMEELRVEWNMMTANYYEQPPVLPLGVFRLLLTRPKKLKSLAMYRLQFAGQPLDYQDLREVVVQNTTLQTVRIEFCKTDGCPNLDLAVTTISQLPQLKEIEVIGLPEFETRVCSADSLQVLGNCRNLHCIKLWGGIWQGPEDNGLVALTEGLKATKSLQDLEIGLFQLNQQSSLAMADLMQVNKSIRRIWLDSNTGVTEETLIPLTNALKTNATILNFSIVSTSAINQPSKEDPRIKELMVEMLKSNYTLRHVAVRTGSEASEQDADLQAHMDMYLKLNRLGRKHLLGNGASNRDEWKLTLSVERNNTSVVYYLLRHNPTFISHCVINPRKRTHRQVEESEWQQIRSPAPKRRRIAVVTPLKKTSRSAIGGGPYL